MRTRANMAPRCAVALLALSIATQASVAPNCSNFTWPPSWPKNMTDLLPPPWLRIDTSGGGTLDNVRITNSTNGTVRFGTSAGPNPGSVSCVNGAKIIAFSWQEEICPYPFWRYSSLRSVGPIFCDDGTTVGTVLTGTCVPGVPRAALNYSVPASVCGWPATSVSQTPTLTRSATASFSQQSATPTASTIPSYPNCVAFT